MSPGVVPGAWSKLRQAFARPATVIGLPRTILRAIKSGRISATKDELGAWVIEPGECHRVYPLVAVDGANAVAVPDLAPRDSATDVLVDELRAMIACMRHEHERAIGDLQRDRDEWRDQAKRLALGAPKAEHAPKAETPQPEPEVSRLRRAWRWMQATG
jgi:hypothetical protein